MASTASRSYGVNWRAGWRQSKAIVVAIAFFFGNATATVDADTPPSPVQLHPIPGMNYVNFYICDRITEQEFNIYVRMLEMHEAQIKMANAFFEQYKREDARYRENELQTYWQRAADVAAAGNPYSRFDIAQQFTDLLRDRSKAVRQIERIENRFFDEVEPFLAEAQLPALTRVREYRRRARCYPFPAEYPGSAIDLSIVLIDMQAQDKLIASNPQALADITVEYEQKLTALRCQFVDAFMNCATQTPLIYSSVKLLRPTNDDPIAQAIYESKSQEALREGMRLTSRIDRIGKRIHDLNSLYVERLAAQLNDVNAAHLRRAYREQAYPPAYPDPYNLQLVLEEAAALNSLTDLQREAIAAFTTSYAAQRDALSEKMAHRFLDYKENWFKHRTRDLNEFTAYKEDMLKLQQQRRQVAATTLQQVRDILDSTQLIDLDTCAVGYEKAANAHQSRESGLDFFP